MRRMHLYLVALGLSFYTLSDRAGWADEPSRLVPGGWLKPHAVPTIDPMPISPQPAVPTQSRHKAPPRRIHQTSQPHKQPSEPAVPLSDNGIRY